MPRTHSSQRTCSRSRRSLPLRGKRPACVRPWPLLIVVAMFWGTPALATSTLDAAPQLVVGSKKFPESALLAELLAQALERRGIAVERRLNLGNTAVAFEALKQGSIDVYPEYSGTALGLLGLDRTRVERDDVVLVVRRELERRYQLGWGPNLGFDNSYGLAVRREFAERHDLHSLSDLGALSQRRHLAAAFSHEFLSREDGYRPLANRYQLRLATLGTEHAVAYQLLNGGRADVIDVYTTEGLIHQFGLVVLNDDTKFFPPYAAAYAYGRRVAGSAPALEALGELSGVLSAERMRTLNRRLEVEGQSAARVASEFSANLAGGSVGASQRQARKRLGFFELLHHDRHLLLAHTARHLELTLLAMLLSVLVAIPLGYLASRHRFGATLSLGITGALQTIPSLALLVLAIPLSVYFLEPFGLGDWALEGSALLALFLYSLLPMVRNTKQGLEGIDPAVLEAARGTGMTERQLLLWVKLPLALPVILAGVRTSFVITVGTATLAAFVGAGGLGVPIIAGLSVQNFTEVWTGAVPAALLALMSDGLFALLQRRLALRLLGRKASALPTR